MPRSAYLALAFAAGIAVPVCAAFAEQPLLPESQWALLRGEASGTAPYENLRALTRLLLRGARLFRPLHAFGVHHRPIQFDDDGIDVIDAVVDFHGLLRPQYEGGF